VAILLPLYIYYFDGTNPQWVETSSGNGFGSGNTSAGGGITSLNTLTDLVQIFEVGSSGNDFNISSLGSSHTFNIPLAGGSGVTGLVSANAQEFWGLKSFKDGLSILDANPLYFYEGLGTSYVSFQAGSGLTGNLSFTLPNTYGYSNQVLSTDGSGILSWISQTGNASVAVTNVAVAVALAALVAIGVAASAAPPPLAFDPSFIGVALVLLVLLVLLLLP
jgi:hypothetical protein